MVACVATTSDFGFLLASLQPFVVAAVDSKKNPVLPVDRFLKNDALYGAEHLLGHKLLVQLSSLFLVPKAVIV